MSQQIWKFPIKVGESELRMPRNADILTVQLQHDSLNIWAWVDPSAETEVRTFVVYGTGHDVDPNVVRYLGTVQQESLVWHLFEKRSPR